MTPLRSLVDQSLLLARRAHNGVRALSGVDELNLGQTPRAAVWQSGSATLWHYPRTTPAARGPVLLVMSLVTRPVIFDLLPGMSFVQHLLEEGFEVYLMDWGEPDSSAASHDLSTYVDRYLPRAVRSVEQHARTRGVSPRARRNAVPPGDAVGVLGYCLGANLAMLTLAGHPDLPIDRLALFAPPLDYRRIAPVASMVAPRFHETTDWLDETGNIPAERVAELIHSVRFTGDLYTYLNLWDALKDRQTLTEHRALVHWAHDNVPFPGGTALEIAEKFVRQRQLERGRVAVGGRIIDLAEIRCPVLSVFGRSDAMVPPASHRDIRSILRNAPVEVLELNVGHVGLFYGKRSRDAMPVISGWLSGGRKSAATPRARHDHDTRLEIQGES